jgi:hypothetical protein
MGEYGKGLVGAVLHEAPSAQTEAFPHGAALAALDRILEAERALIDRARLLLDMSKLLSMIAKGDNLAAGGSRGGAL